MNVSVNNKYVNKNNYNKANFNKQAGNWQQLLAFLRAVAREDQLTVLNGLVVRLVVMYLSICLM